MRFFSVIATAAALFCGGVPAFAGCLNIYGETIACDADCDRQQAVCRAFHPYPADGPAERVFRRLAGRDRLLSRTDLARQMHNELRAMWQSMHGFAYPHSFAATRPLLEWKAAPLIARRDMNGDGVLSEGEALRLPASFYNQFANDQSGTFTYRSYWSEARQKYIQEGFGRNPEAAPYIQKYQ